MLSIASAAFVAYLCIMCRMCYQDQIIRGERRARRNAQYPLSSTHDVVGVPYEATGHSIEEEMQPRTWGNGIDDAATLVELHAFGYSRASSSATVSVEHDDGVSLLNTRRLR